jgi:plasmid stabilization system protein ParE
MPRINYSPRASYDLIRLFNFLADRNEEVALRAITTIRDSISSLKKMPKIGRPLDDGFRELIIDFSSSGYIALYDLDEVADELTIHAVKHQKENDYK